MMTSLLALMGLICPAYANDVHFVKVIPPKPYLKMDHIEIGPHLGAIGNDPFVVRYLAGFSVAWHATDIFAVELQNTFSPDFGSGDWKPITHQLIEKNRVTPDISKIGWHSSITTQFSPIYGKVATRRGLVYFDVYGRVGVGGTRTRDALELFDREPEPASIRTQVQLHPTAVYGAGVRIGVNDTTAVRLEGTGWQYVEVIHGSVLEMKPAFATTAAVTWLVRVRRADEGDDEDGG